MKKCKQCKKLRSIEDFYTDNNKEDGLRTNCVFCTNKVTKKRNDEIIDSYRFLFGGCCVCGYDKCNAAIEFHHINAKTKSKTISQMKTAQSHLLIKELLKCVPLCCICHREHHAGVGLSTENLQNIYDDIAPKWSLYSREETFDVSSIGTEPITMDTFVLDEDTKK